LNCAAQPSSREIKNDCIPGHSFSSSRPLILNLILPLAVHHIALFGERSICQWEKAKASSREEIALRIKIFDCGKANSPEVVKKCDELATREKKEFDWMDAQQKDDLNKYNKLTNKDFDFNICRGEKFVK
jgi:hypothetical protein